MAILKQAEERISQLAHDKEELATELRALRAGAGQGDSSGADSARQAAERRANALEADKKAAESAMMQLQAQVRALQGELAGKQAGGSPGDAQLRSTVQRLEAKVQEQEQSLAAWKGQAEHAEQQEAQVGC